MSRFIVSAEELEKLRSQLQKPSFVIDGHEEKAPVWPSFAFSRQLNELVLAGFRAHPKFRAAGPVLVGSAARDELCPRSDLDFVFVGDVDAAREFISDQQARGIKLRSRLLGASDWTTEGEAPDWIALLEAKAVFPEHQIRVDEQSARVRTFLIKTRQKWLKGFIKEKSERKKRDQTVANVLEPNLKYGLGGLRDLNQAVAVGRLFAELFQNDKHVNEVLAYYSGFWLLLRHWLHLNDGNDILSSSAQFDAARWMGMSHRDFMREVQKGLSRVDFYSEWVLLHAAASPTVRAKYATTKIETPKQAMSALKKDPSVLMQRKIRSRIDAVFSDARFKRNNKERGAFIYSFLKPGADEKYIEAVFRSHVIDFLCPSFKPLIGLTQHDQYHRYTADKHLMQACIQWQRLYAKPSRASQLRQEILLLSARDTKIVAWSVLYHDMMKGREEDHSEAGEALVRKELKSFGVEAKVIEGVAWIVRHHLLLSQAAFRKNPMSPQTWLGLEEEGVVGDQLRRLAVFTAVDILATNPDAWTPWKAQLLANLLKTLRSSTVRQYIEFRGRMEKKKLGAQVDFIDPFLLTQVPLSVLTSDMDALSKSKDAQDIRVVKGVRNSLWVRFFEREDKAGLFSAYVEKLFAVGLSVRHAAVHTLPGIGVYDWFEIANVRDPQKVHTRLKHAQVSAKAMPAVTFDSVSLVSEEPEEWVFSFKAKDQPGCLRVAAQALTENGLSIRSARVHTWGQQVDDLFHVRPEGDPYALLKNLKAALLKPRAGA